MRDHGDLNQRSINGSGKTWTDSRHSSEVEMTDRDGLDMGDNMGNSERREGIKYDSKNFVSSKQVVSSAISWGEGPR